MKKLNDDVITQMADLVASQFSSVETEEQEKRIGRQIKQMRSALVICLGGTGQLMGVHLKALLMARLGPRWEEKIRLLAFDTTDEPYSVQAGDQLVGLDAGAEFFNIGQVPVPSIMRNIDNLEAIQERLGAVLSNLPASVMRSGAKQLRPLGLMALLWNFSAVSKALHQAIWQLAGREMQTADVVHAQQGINVFICGSLVGGTGSGIFLDMAYLVKSLFEELGTQGEFCHITGVVALPQAFQGVPGANLHPNTGAALEELNHAMVKGGFKSRYPDGRVVDIPETPFNLIYALDGVDERGQTWDGISSVSAMAAEGIYLQMASQLGKKGDNAFDNVDEILLGRTGDGDGTFLSSFGVGYIEFPAPDVAHICAHWLLADLIKTEWLVATKDSAVLAESAKRLQGITPLILPETLLRDEGGTSLRLDLRQPSWLPNKGVDEVTAEAARYINNFRQARVQDLIVGNINQQGEVLAQQQKGIWGDWVERHLFHPNYSVRHLGSTLRQAQTEIGGWLTAAHKRLNELAQEQDRETLNLTQFQGGIQRAADSFFVGRSARIRQALNDYFQVAKIICEGEIEQAQLRAQTEVWRVAEEEIDRLSQQLQLLLGHLEMIEQQSQTATRELVENCQQAGVSRLSLADEKYIQKLYTQYRPTQVNMRTLSGWQTNKKGVHQLAELDLKGLTGRFLSTLAELFTPILEMTVEGVIADRADEVPIRARREQLFRLATPSWSIDRARLPDGGADLVRLEVLGVSDVSETLFGDETMAVSTYDPHRLIALVVAAGAPRSALQQYKLYSHALERVRGYRPMFVLPQFIANAGQAKLAFALGSLFGLVYNQGTYFYYRPLDQLERPIRLDNGLSNAIQAISTRERAVHEIMERVDAQIAQLGLHQAIEMLTRYYEEVSDRRGQTDELTRELKQLVRQYADELRQINDLSFTAVPTLSRNGGGA